jgi:GR25 family glycosyltransferase involved in LPS biosynthesis
MIVFEKDNKRLNNYEKINETINCTKFSAINSVDYFEEYSKIALEKNYTSMVYINEIMSLPGKLGCNLSHQMLTEDILENSSTDWNLILEDDITLNNFNLYEIENILTQANLNESNYIQLCTNKRFLGKQKTKNEIYKNLFPMVAQWHTTAYFINKNGINILKNCYPITENIDLKFSCLIKELNSLCWINNIFSNEGDESGSQKHKTKFGSIIYESQK